MTIRPVRGPIPSLLVGLALALAVVVAPWAAGATTYPPVNRPGPPLSVPADALARSLSCTGNLVTAAREPILLVPGTTLTPAADFSWNYERVFTARRLPWCAVTLPNNAMGDIQVAGEYVVNPIRVMHARTGRKVQILGHSQGGMVPRWALRFWPDTRAMVSARRSSAARRRSGSSSTTARSCGR